MTPRVISELYYKYIHVQAQVIQNCTTPSRIDITV